VYIEQIKNVSGKESLEIIKYVKLDFSSLLSFFLQLHLDENHIHYICPECNEPFSSQTALDEHVNKTCPSIFQLCPLAPFCTEDMVRNLLS
jgi:transcription initiation factor IIE alpha subunit